MTDTSEPKHKAMALRTTILRADCGSKGFGLSIPSSDNDELGVCVEDFSCHTCLEGKFEQYIHRDPSVLDLTIYSLEKFLRLACHGNPTILSLLFATSLLQVDARGRQLQELAPSLISKHWGKRFLGYMESQRQKLLGERGQKRVNRKELEEKYGYDTKYAMHLLRLGYQGVEVMETGHMSMPVGEPTHTFLMEVREGKVTINEVLETAGNLERHLKDLLHDSHLPDHPDREVVEGWMRRTYLEVWKAREVTTMFTSDGGLA